MFRIVTCGRDSGNTVFDSHYQLPKTDPIHHLHAIPRVLQMESASGRGESIPDLQAIDSAASCSASVLEMPGARLGIAVDEHQRRSAMSESAVVGSLVMLRIRIKREPADRIDRIDGRVCSTLGTKFPDGIGGVRMCS